MCMGKDSAEAGADQRVKRKLSRRWHPRGFTGCPTCRRRHVKCDETTPVCNNCTRLGLSCDGYEQKVMFKVYTGGAASKASTSKSLTRNTKTHSIESRNASQGVAHTSIIQFEDPKQSMVVRPSSTLQTTESAKTIHDASMSMLRPDCVHLLYSVPTNLPNPDIDYYAHFLKTVSTILIVWDTPYNANPFRLAFPSLGQSSWTLTEAMKALGALHLANISTGEERRRHSQYAMSMYGSIVSNLRQNSTAEVGLADMATSLLLCFFEMIDSHSESGSWKIHLLGARHFFQRLLQSPNPTSAQTQSFDLSNPMRRFLVSLMAYLDVAGACATGDGTMLPGNYWDTYGGGWEYNLGVPGFAQMPETDGPLLQQIRQTWSRLMLIQADISSFAKAKKHGLSARHQQVLYQDLDQRLKAWSNSLPECFNGLRNLDDAIEGFSNWQILEATGSVEVYEKGTIIYLHNVASSGSTRPATAPQHILDAVARILVLTKKFCKGIVQLGMLWPLFIAGGELTDPADQEFVRQRFSDTARYGSMNVKKALDMLEYVWLCNQRRGDGPGIYLTDLQNSILIP